jgi:peptidoglycan hydrolase CwlO-like protein
MAEVKQDIADMKKDISSLDSNYGRLDDKMDVLFEDIMNVKADIRRLKKV